MYMAKKKKTKKNHIYLYYFYWNMVTEGSLTWTLRRDSISYTGLLYVPKTKAFRKKNEALKMVVWEI